MGIPKYFKHIVKKYEDDGLLKNTKNSDIKINNLYFDMNCLIHPCVNQVVSEYQGFVKEYNRIRDSEKYKSQPDFITKLEKKIFNEIDNYLCKIIDQVNPSKLIYLSIDGVAPRAKMEQQRLRRFKSIKEKKMRKDIHSKYNIESINFDTNCITPGTIFMYKLSKYLENTTIKILKKYNCCIILDDSQNKGEGEHKIMQYIKKYTKSDINCIYGLDADLIMLSLSIKSQMFLIREEVHFGKVNKNSFIYFNVYQFGDILYNEIKDKIFKKILELHKDNPNENDPLSELVIDKYDLIHDYICLCFLIGNDFLPHIPGIDISNNSINDLLNIYIDIFSIRQRYLVEEFKINFIFIRQIITRLYSNEHIYLKDYQRKIDRFRPFFKGVTQKIDIELGRLNYYPIFNKNKKINYYHDNWRYDYYDYYFNVKNEYMNSNDIYNICNNYIEGLQWNLKYYLSECPSFNWYYQYRAAPLLKDLTKFLLSRVYPKDFNDQIEYTSLEQLAIVLPKESSYLWSENYRKVLNSDIKLQSFYPIDYRIDTVNKIYLHQCEPILMNIDDNYIREVFKKIKLNDFEKKRIEISGLKIYYGESENIKMNY